MLLCTSFAEVGCNWKSIYAAVRTMISPIAERFQKESFDGDTFKKEDGIEDPVPEHERVPLWMWGSVLILSILISCVVMGVQFGQNVGITIVGGFGPVCVYVVVLTLFFFLSSHPLCVPVQFHWVREFGADEHQPCDVDRLRVF